MFTVPLFSKKFYKHHLFKNNIYIALFCGKEICASTWTFYLGYFMFYLYFFFSILFSLVLLWTWNLCMAIWVQNVSQLQLQTENQRPCEAEMLLIQFSSEFRNLCYFFHIFMTLTEVFFHGSNIRSSLLWGNIGFHLNSVFYPRRIHHWPWNHVWSQAWDSHPWNESYS